jgi:hypothetical protein
MQLLLDAHQRIESLPAPLAAEVRSLVGWTQKQEELLAQSGIQDHWQVIGRRRISEDTLRVQSTCLILPVGRQAFSSALMLGQVYAAEAVFFPGARPYRALLKNPMPMTGHSLQLTRAADVAGLESGVGTALMENPRIER